MGKLKRWAKAKAPELCFTSGIVNGAAALYFAARGGRKAAYVKEDFFYAEDLRRDRAIMMAQNSPEDREEIAELIQEGYDDKKQFKENRKDLVMGYVKAYAPAAGFATASAVSFGACYKIQRVRYLGAVAAYEGAVLAHDAYRERVKEHVGEEVEDMIHRGLKKEVVEEEVVNEKGKKETVEKEIVTDTLVNSMEVSQYARFFSETHPEWDPSPEINLGYLRAREQKCNLQFRRDGYIFLNDVYRIIGGIEPTEEGQIVGWLMGNGDDVVDFGLYSGNNSSVRFINGQSDGILLDFNVDGVIIHKLDQAAKWAH